jgi:hypothetical protein
MGTLKELDTPGQRKVNEQLAITQRQRNRAQNAEAHLGGLVAGLQVTIDELMAEAKRKDALIAQLNGQNAALKEHCNRQGEELFKLRGADPSVVQPVVIDAKADAPADAPAAS